MLNFAGRVKTLGIKTLRTSLGFTSVADQRRNGPGLDDAAADALDKQRTDEEDPVN